MGNSCTSSDYAGTGCSCSWSGTGGVGTVGKGTKTAEYGTTAGVNNGTHEKNVAGNTDGEGQLCTKEQDGSEQGN